MAWTTPSVVATGDVGTASWANIIVNDLIYLKGKAGTVIIEDAITASGTVTGSSWINAMDRYIVSDDDQYYINLENSSDCMITFNPSQYVVYDRQNKHYAGYLGNGVSAFSFGHGHTSTQTSYMILRTSGGAALYMKPNAAANGLDFTTTEP